MEFTHPFVCWFLFDFSAVNTQFLLFLVFCFTLLLPILDLFGFLFVA